MIITASIRGMSRAAAVAIATILMTSQTTSAQTPILQYLFNETGTDAISTGSAAITLPMMQWDGATWISADNHAADGSGVSGQPGDRAYFDPSLMLDPGQTPGTSNSHYFGGFAGGFNVEEVQSLSAITVQGWFKPPAGKKVGEEDGSFGALVGNLGSSSNDGGWVIRTLRSAEAGTLEFRYGEEDFSLDHRSVTSTAGIYSEIDEWVFFAATLDAATGQVEFFKGTTTLSVESAGTGNQGFLLDSVIAMSNRNFYVGNSGSEGAQWSQGRAFSGSIDNIRVFDNVLTMSQLEEIRMTDLEAAPELMGDFNDDGKVDAADYVVWRKNDSGDPTKYDLWRSNFGLPNAAAASGQVLGSPQVPEPTTSIVSTLLLGWLALSGRAKSFR